MNLLISFCMFGSEVQLKANHAFVDKIFDFGLATTDVLSCQTKSLVCFACRAVNVLLFTCQLHVLCNLL